MNGEGASQSNVLRGREEGRRSRDGISWGDEGDEKTEGLGI